MKKIITVLFLILFSVNSFAQELDARVEVNFEQLETVYKEKLVSFKSQVEEYLNNTKFTGGAWDWPRIKCSFNIFITGASSEVNYNAQIVITSSRPIEGNSEYNQNSLILSIMDNAWQYVYEQNQSMYFNESYFDPLLSFLDYYAFLILGFDADSYEAFAGTTPFNKALRIAVMGGSSGSTGWQFKMGNYNRRSLVEDLTGAKFQQFRQDYFDYHYNGLDVFYKYRNETYKNIVKLINNIDRLKKTGMGRSSLLNVFFDAKAGEIISYLKDYPDKTIFETLKKIDPSHITKYLKAEEE